MNRKHPLPGDESARFGGRFSRLGCRKNGMLALGFPNAADHNADTSDNGPAPLPTRPFSVQQEVKAGSSARGIPLRLGWSRTVSRGEARCESQAAHLSLVALAARGCDSAEQCKRSCAVTRILDGFSAFIPGFSSDLISPRIHRAVSLRRLQNRSGGTWLGSNRPDGF